MALANPVADWLSMLNAPARDIRRNGAKCDGTTDDRLAINAAIAVMAAIGGGIVDLPEGTIAVGASGTGTYITLASNVTVRGRGPGTRLKVKDSNGHFETLFAAPPGTANVCLENFTVDMNPSGNSVAFTAATGQRQTGVSIQDATGFRMRNVRFDPYSGVWAVTIGGTACSDVIITGGCFFRFDPKGGTTSVDNSTIYLNGDGCVVSGCVFKAAIGNGAHGAIELHDSGGTATGNTIDGFQSSINLVTTDTGTAPPYTAHVCTGNVITRCAYGPRVWPLTGYVARGVTITGNEIGLSQVTHNTASCFGAGVWWDSTCQGAVEGLTIADNNIIFEDEGAGRAVGSEFLNVGISVTPQGNTASGVTVTGNKIIRCPGTAIRLSGFDANSHLKNSRISDNVIVDAGNNPGIVIGSGAFRTAIIFQSNMTDVVVEDNSIHDTGASALEGVNALLYASGLGTLTRVKVRNNTLSAANSGGTPLAVSINVAGIFGDNNCVGDRETVTYAATYAPAVCAGGRTKLVTLTGAFQVNAPTHRIRGGRVRMELIQDGTGGRAVTWTSPWKVGAFSPTTTANTRTAYEFEDDGTNLYLVAQPATGL